MGRRRFTCDAMSMMIVIIIFRQQCCSDRYRSCCVGVARISRANFCVAVAAVFSIKTYCVAHWQQQQQRGEKAIIM